MQKLTLGSVFQVADLDVFGVVTDFLYAMPLSYFFVDVERWNDHGYVQPDTAILIAEHSFHGLKKGIWPLLGAIPNFDARRWPHPLFVFSSQRGPHSSEQPIVLRADRAVINGAHVPINDWSTVEFTADKGCHGHMVLLRLLNQILQAGDVSEGRVFRVPTAKPDGGQEFRDYLSRTSHH